MTFYRKLIISVFALVLLCENFPGYSQWIRKGNTGGLSLGESVAVDNSGNVYSTGVFFCNLVVEGDTLFNTTCTDFIGGPRYDGFIIKYDGDGTLIWARQLTGEKGKKLSIKGITTDNTGNCYITGSYTGSLTLGGTTITNNTAVQDLFVAKYLSNGAFSWVQTNFARSATSFIEATTIASDGNNAFVGGIHKEQIVFNTDTLFSTTTQEFFIAKFNTSGTYQWVTSSKGDSSVSEGILSDLTIDQSNHIYATGSFKDTLIIFPGDTLKALSGQSALFVARFSDPPALDWVIKENANNALANGISLNKNNRKIFIAGQYKGAPTIGGTTVTSSGTDFGAFVAGYDTSGTFLWTRTTRVTSGDSAATGRSVGIDQFDGVYLAGNFGKKNSSSSITSGSVTKTGFNSYDGFVTKYDSLGNVKWIQPLGGYLDDDVRDIYAKDSSNIYIGGYFSIYMRVDSMEVKNDTTGGFNSYTAEIDVCPYYSANITAGGPTTFCLEDSVLLTATAGAGFTYQWQKNNVNIAGATGMTYYASDSAEYRVIITNPAIPCTKYSPGLFVTVYSLPKVTISKNDTTVFCTGDNVRLSVPLGNKYQWLESGTILPIDTNFSYTATTNGNYSVIARNSKGCKDTSVVTAVTVVPYPTATVTPSGKFIICNGDSITLNSNTATGYKYQWLKNNAVLVNDTLSVYKAKTTGIYKVKISNQLGCSTTSTTADTVTIITTPPATITVSGPTTYCNYLPSTLIANSGVGLKYTWERNAAALLPGDTLASYTPTVSGNYRVKVRNSTGCEATSSAVTITVNSQPTAGISAGGATSICNGDSVQLNATTGPGYTFVWQRNGTTITSATASTYYAKTTGNYRVLVSNSDGCSDTSSLITVTTNPIPAATVSALGITSFCTGDSVELKANSGTGFTYQWEIDGTPIVGATAISYKSKISGSYSVVVTNTSNCSKESSGISVTTFSTPPANIIASGTTTFCEGDSVTLQANTGGGYTYVWRKDGFILPSAVTSALKVKTNGSYTVQVSITSTCTNTSGATSVTVKPNQKPIITINGTDISTSFFTTYQWNLNGVPITGATNQIYNAVTNGLYSVTVQNNNNCTSTALPVTVCVPAPYITTAGTLLKGSPGMTWQWYLEDILINGATSQNYLAQASGNYKVKVRDNTTCESYSLSVLVCVPAPTITVDANNILTASSGVSYQWYLDDAEIVGANTQVYIADQSGSYTVKVEDLNGCENISMPITLTITDRQEATNLSGILLYPNPTSSSVTISFKNTLTGIFALQLMDLPGNIILSDEFNKSATDYESTVNLEHVPAGTYLLRITDKNKNSFIQKVNKITN